MVINKMRRHVSKVFLDSRWVEPDGKTFLIPGEALLLNPDSRVWLGEFTCVASWDTIDDTNNTFRINESNGSSSSRTVTIPNGVYDIESLRGMLQTLLSGDRPAFMGAYTVTRLAAGTSGSTYRRFKVSVSQGTFSIPTEENFLRSICHFDADAAKSSHDTGFVDVRRTHSIYIHSSFGNNNSVSPTGVRSIIAMVPVHVGYGGLVQASLSGSEHDCVEAGCHSLSSVKLSLHDVAGNELNLNGGAWSATLVFER